VTVLLGNVILTPIIHVPLFQRQAQYLRELKVATMTMIVYLALFAGIHLAPQLEDMDIVIIRLRKAVPITLLTQMSMELNASVKLVG